VNSLTFYPFFSVGFIIFKDHLSQTFKSCKKGFSMIGLGKFSYESFQVRILGDHKCSDRYMKLSGLLRHVIAFIHYVWIQTYTVLVIGTIPLPYAAWLSVGYHKDLFIGIPFSSQKIHGQL